MCCFHLPKSRLESGLNALSQKWVPESSVTPCNVVNPRKTTESYFPPSRTLTSPLPKNYPPPHLSSFPFPIHLDEEESKKVIFAFFPPRDTRAPSFLIFTYFHRPRPATRRHDTDPCCPK